MGKGILFTLTCFISRPDKMKQTLVALNSIKKQEPHIKKDCYILVVNECPTSRSKIASDYLKKKFPWIDKVINKKYNCGQAASLNIIIDFLKQKKFKYWLHWEESWKAQKPFLKLCKYAMYIGIDQLQLTEDIWQEDHCKVLDTPHKRKIYIQTYDDYSEYEQCKRTGKKRRKFRPHPKCRSNKSLPWPLWSLRPGIDVVERVLEVGYFTEDPDFWPVHFELEWAYNWSMLCNIVKGGVECAKRQGGHKSFSEKYLR